MGSWSWPTPESPPWCCTRCSRSRSSTWRQDPRSRNSSTTAIQEPVRDVEARCLDVVHALKQSLDVPVAVKLTPYFSSFAELALRLVETGADGLVLFNRFMLPEIDAQTLTVAPAVGLSHSSDARLPQTWIALLRDQLTVSLAGTG